jgi:membrane protein
MSVQIGMRGIGCAPSTLLRRICHRIQADDCVDLAAQISFYFVLSLFPFFLVMAAVVGWLPSTTLWKSFVTWMVTYLPSESRSMMFNLILSLANGTKGILSFGLVTAIWSASSGFVSLMESLSIAYGRNDTRPYWRKHAVAICFTVLAAVFALLCFGLMTLGHWGSEWIPSLFSTWNVPPAVWEFCRWTCTLVLMSLGVELVNSLLPSPKRPWHWMTPGAAFAVITLVAATMGLNLYVRHFSSYPRIYGTLGGFIVLMLWIYIASFILLVGALTDREMEKMTNEAKVG